MRRGARDVDLDRCGVRALKGEGGRIGPRRAEAQLQPRPGARVHARVGAAGVDEGGEGFGRGCGRDLDRLDVAAGLEGDRAIRERARDLGPAQPQHLLARGQGLGHLHPQIARPARAVEPVGAVFGLRHEAVLFGQEAHKFGLRQRRARDMAPLAGEDLDRRGRGVARDDGARKAVDGPRRDAARGARDREDPALARGMEPEAREGFRDSGRSLGAADRALVEHLREVGHVGLGVARPEVGPRRVCA